MWLPMFCTVSMGDPWHSYVSILPDMLYITIVGSILQNYGGAFKCNFLKSTRGVHEARLVLFVVEQMLEITSSRPIHKCALPPPFNIPSCSKVTCNTSLLSNIRHSLTSHLASPLTLPCLSPCLALPYLTSHLASHLALPHLALPLTLPCLASHLASPLTLPCLTSHLALLQEEEHLRRIRRDVEARSQHMKEKLSGKVGAGNYFHFKNCVEFLVVFYL